MRALHHYDTIGLLKPAQVTESGYRLYDDACLRRLGSILLMRELMFPLKDIKRILDGGSDGHAMLADHIRLLEMQRDRLNAIIASVSVGRPIIKYSLTALHPCSNASETERIRSSSVTPLLMTSRSL